MRVPAFILMLLLFTPAADAMIGGVHHRCLREFAAEGAAPEAYLRWRMDELSTELREFLTEWGETLQLVDGVADAGELQADFPTAPMLGEFRSIASELLAILGQLGVETTIGDLHAATATPSQARETVFALVGVLGNMEPTPMAAHREYLKAKNLETVLTRFSHLLAYFSQTQRTRWLIIVDEESFRCERQFTSHYRYWEAAYFGEGTLDESEKELQEHERRAAQLLVQDAHDVRARAESTLSGERSADVSASFVTTELIELKSFLEEDADSGRVKKRVESSLKGGGQAPRILIDARDAGLSFDEAFRGARRLGGLLRDNPRYLDRLQELTIVGDDYHAIFTFLSVEAYEERRVAVTAGQEFQAWTEDRLREGREAGNLRWRVDAYPLVDVPFDAEDEKSE